MDEWNISVEEAAKIMGKSKDFIFQAIQNGFIKGIVIQNKTRRTAHIPRKPFLNTCSLLLEINKGEENYGKESIY